MALWRMEIRWEFCEDMGDRDPQIARDWQARRCELTVDGGWTAQ
ncbi:MAG: hypothetical protein RL481_2144 [Pseudomonadota bacterium]|jgi:hypothetical protein